MRRINLIIIGTLFIAAPFASAAIPDPVKTDTGLISGTNGTSSDIRVFKGIPFAAPPVGELRWQPPQPPAAWGGVRKSDQFGPRCMQPVPGALGGTPSPGASEDCLYVNVWTGAKSASERRPVIVFAYGGGFISGAGSEPRYDGESLAKKGVVFVTFNYRLGVFGFFAHPELTELSPHKASGNYGLMDFIAVLNWVHRNIENFGGDPKRVTIMGESAGSAMVAAMVGSLEGQGLFQRAIAESGAWMGLGIGRMAERAPAEQMGKELGTLADLRSKPADELMRRGSGTGIIIDGWIITEDLSVTFMQGRQNDVDVLVGSNQDEGTFFAGGGPSNAAQQLTDQAAAIRQRQHDGCFPATVPRRVGRRSCRFEFEPRPRRNGVAHEDMGEASIEARKRKSVLVLLHARAACRFRTAQPRRHTYRGAGICLQQSSERCKSLDRHRSSAGGYTLLVLGQFRCERRSQWKRPGCLACIQGENE